MFVVKILFFLYLLSTVSSENFYKIFKDKNGAKIRGIVTNEPMLAIATENFVTFGNIEENFSFNKKSKIEFTTNLTGDTELLEFKFIFNDSVIVCNNVECSVCNSASNRALCTTLASFPIKSVTSESADEMIFLRVVHEKNNASFYSFIFENSTYKKIGQKLDPIIDVKEFKSLYSFSNENHLYFVDAVKRYDPLASCLREQQNQSVDMARMNNEIVISQVCNNDESDLIASLMQITVSCGEEITNNANSSYASYKTIHRNIYQNNVTGITYLSKDDQLFIAFQDSPTFSFTCKFNISKIEAEFCKTWNYCQNDPGSYFSDIEKLSKIFIVMKIFIYFFENIGEILLQLFQGCSLKKQNSNECFKYVNTTETSICDSQQNISVCQVSINQLKYERIESHSIIFGEIVQEDFYPEVYGNIISSDNQFYIIKNHRLLKRLKDRSNYLDGLPSDDLKMITPWDSKNGIVYVDPRSKDTIYFKDINCSKFECFDILHSTNVKCIFCEKDDLSTDGSMCEGDTKTFCGPLWQKVDSVNYVVWLNQFTVYDTSVLKLTLNGVVISNMRCFPINDTDEDYRKCNSDIDNRLATHFIALPSNHSSPNKVIIIVAAVGTFFVLSIILTVILCSFHRQKIQSRKTQNDIEMTDLNNTESSPFLQHWTSSRRPSYFDALINIDKIVEIRPLGSGNFGKVSLAEYREEENEAIHVAIKKCENCSRSDVIKEIKALRLCTHENILSFIGWTEINDEMCIITEYMSGGDLYHFLINPNNRIIVSSLYLYIFQVLDAMIYLRQNKILHRDLAARNCILNDNKDLLKICDFGLARKMNINYEYLPEAARQLPVRWMALETIRDYKFTAKGDIWSFAVLMWEMFQRGARPYKEISNENISRLLDYLLIGCRLERPQHCPEKLYEIMKTCWSEIPENRPTFLMLRTEIQEIYDCLRTDETSNFNYFGTELHEYVNQNETQL